MKTLVIAPQPFFTPRGTPFSVYYRTLISTELGLKIDFLTYGEGDDVDIPGVRIIRIPRFKWLGNVKIGPSPLKLFLDVFIFFWMVGLLIKNRYELVHAHEEAVFLAVILKPFFRFKLIYDMHSSLPQQLTNFKFTTSKFLINLFKKLEDKSLQSADAIITICPDLYNYVSTVIKNSARHFLIENSIFDEVKLFENNGKQTNTDSIKFVLPVTPPPGKPLIVYAGTLESYQGIDILIRAFKFVTNKKPETCLLIVGGTPEQVAYYKRLAEENGAETNVIFTGRVPQPVAKYYNKLADVLVSPRSEGTNTPLKVYEQLDSGKPLVATNIYSHTQVLNEEVAFLVNPSPESLADGIIQTLTDRENVNEKVKKAKLLYENKYSRKVYKGKLKKLLEALN